MVAREENPGPGDRSRQERPPPQSVIPLRTRVAAWPNALPLPVRFDPSLSVLVAGSSRSGTTWLGQMLATSPGLCLVNEPFSPKMPGLSRAGFTWRTARDPEADWPAGEAVFRRVFSGRGMSLKLIRLNGTKLLHCSGLVIKAVRVNRLLPWIARHFELRGTVVIVRHPCAVVSSQMLHFKLNSVTLMDDLDYVERHLPHLLPFVRGLHTEEERRALTWALDQHAVQEASGPRPWQMTSYESLVARGRAELERLFSALGLDVPIEAVELLDRNSWQAREASVDHTRAPVDERLGVWRKRLSPDQVSRILTVVEACGIRGYSEDVFPSMGALDPDSLS